MATRGAMTTATNSKAGDMMYRTDAETQVTEAVTTTTDSATPQLILDIGTHKVLGLATRPTPAGVEILAASMRTHPNRAMRDGQVHDVPSVAHTLRQVVDSLENALGTSFKHAYIAAAGRALQTSRGHAARAEKYPILFTAEMQRNLEWEAVADAQAKLLAALPAEERTKGFYCIAHSRTSNALDGEVIASLVDQRGQQFAVDVLATFLPGVVVDSLEAVLDQARLTMRGLTLEPVAALEAVVPATMRHLKLMLVDVGAGTADIAYTGGGTVQAFAMAPLGGDSITDALAKQLLLDFSVAEQAKRMVSEGHVAQVSNVLGQPVTLERQLLNETIEPATKRLIEAIARMAEAWDMDTLPEAVLLVGGGSNTPGFVTELAYRLGLPPNRVVVRDRSAVRGVTGQEQLQGPDVVTALGIALRFAHDKDLPPVRVRVNGRPISLFQPERCTVREAARIAGIPLHHIVGRLGQGMTVTVNDEIMAIPGRRGQRAAVLVNNAPATLDTLLNNNDYVLLETPEEGDAARITVGQLAARWSQQRLLETGQQSPRIQLNGTWRSLPLKVERDGSPVRLDETVDDRDVFEMAWPHTVGELLAAVGLDVEPQRPFTIILNGRPMPLDIPAELRLNGMPVGPSARINDGDRLDAVARTSVALYELLSHPKIEALKQVETDALSGEDSAIENTPATGALDGHMLDQGMATRNVHSKPKPRKLILLVRGESAGFTTVVHDGDDVTIRYE